MQSETLVTGCSRLQDGIVFREATLSPRTPYDVALCFVENVWRVIDARAPERSPQRWRIADTITLSSFTHKLDVYAWYSRWH